MSATVRTLCMLALAAVFAGACSADRPLESLSEVSDLRAASARTTLDGVDVTLTASVQRDYMPGEADRPGISVTATLRSEEVRPPSPFLVPLPDGIVIEQVYVVRDDRVWTATVRSPPERTGNGRFQQASARDGPRWEPKQTVDVIVRVRLREEAPFYLAARAQPIRRVE